MFEGGRILRELAALRTLRRATYRRFLLSVLVADAGFLSLFVRRDIAPESSDVVAVATGVLAFVAFTLGMRDARHMRALHERIHVLSRMLRSEPW